MRPSWRRRDRNGSGPLAMLWVQCREGPQNVENRRRSDYAVKRALSALHLPRTLGFTGSDLDLFIYSDVAPCLRVLDTRAAGLS